MDIQGSELYVHEHMEFENSHGSLMFGWIWK